MLRDGKTLAVIGDQLRSAGVVPFRSVFRSLASVSASCRCILFCADWSRISHDGGISPVRRTTMSFYEICFFVITWLHVPYLRFCPSLSAPLRCQRRSRYYTWQRAPVRPPHRGTIQGHNHGR